MLFELMIAYRNRRKPLAAISVLREVNSTDSDPEPWLYAEGYKILGQVSQSLVAVWWSVSMLIDRVVSSLDLGWTLGKGYGNAQSSVEKWKSGCR